MKRPLFLILILAVIASLLLLIKAPPSTTPPSESLESKANRRTIKASPSTIEQDEFQFSPPPFQQSNAKLQNDPNSEMSEEAIALNDTTLTEDKKLDLLHSIITTYCKRTNGGDLPSGDNREITNGLLGENSKRIAFLSAQSPLIGPQGNLIDQWGESYTFHLNSLSKYSIESAGPDRIHYTEDDIIINPEFSRAP